MPTPVPSPPNQAHRPTDRSARLAAPLFLSGCGSLWVYLCFVFAYRESYGGMTFGALATVLLVLVGLAGLGWLARAAASGPRAATVLNLGLTALTTFLLLITADTALGAYSNRRARSNPLPTDLALRESDPTIWHGELFPRHYYPTDRSFFLYKPGVSGSERTYGEFYFSEMLEHPLLVDSVLEAKPLTYRIGPTGLRETEALAASRIFALGDSFTMGYGTDEGRTWTDLLGEMLGQPIYNLGVSSTGPRQHLMLLQHLLEAHRDSMQVEHVLWMIYEGNDLENSYDEVRPRGTEAPRGTFEGTVIGSLLSLPSAVKQASILRKAADELRSRAAGSAFAHGGIELEGLESPFPLYRSERWGYSLFNPQDVERATRDRDYVLGHPNWPLLEATFQEMAELARDRGFRVTILVAPSSARAYGADFDRFPALSAQPYLIDLVVDLARKHRFDVVNLLVEMRAASAERFLFYRDDHHWNAEGNAEAARVVARVFNH